MTDYGDERENSRNEAVSTTDQAESDLINLETQTELANKALLTDSQQLSQYYAKVKTSINANTINEKTQTLTLQLTSAEDLGSMEFTLTSTGASCLQADEQSLCNGAKRTKRFNPKTASQQLTITSADKKAGITLLQIKICIPSTQNCITKTQRITIQP
jgi:hypothetical protein